MDTVDTLTQRNADFAGQRFTPGLRMMPSMRTFVIGCVDPRVDPAQVLGIELGEVAIIRNIGGRITASVLQELALLRTLTQAAGGDFDHGFNFILLQHTDCGILHMQRQPDLLAEFFGIATASLDTKHVRDPCVTLKVDAAVLVADPHVPTGLRVTGLLYDVTTGHVDTVIAPPPTAEVLAPST